MGVSTGSRQRACRVSGPGTVLARRLEREHRPGTLHRDPEYIERTKGLVHAYTRYFSPEVRGLEHLPADGPVFVVGNHCGLLDMPEVWITALSIVDRVTQRPAYSLTYDLLFALPVIRAVPAPHRRHSGVEHRGQSSPGRWSAGARLPGWGLGSLPTVACISQHHRFRRVNPWLSGPTGAPYRSASRAGGGPR